MEIIIQKVSFQTQEDLKLIEVQKMINEIRDNNQYAEIVLHFKDGILAYWSKKQTHEF